MRTLTITAAEWASARDGALWLVREGLWDAPPDTDVLAGQSPFKPTPPVEFVQASAPCETCGGTHLVIFRNGDLSETYYGPTACPDCRIELVGPCLLCGGSGRTLGGPLGEDVGDCRCAMTDGLIVFGHAYAVGSPSPIVQVPFLNVRQTPYDFAHGHTGPLIEVTQNGQVLLWTHHDGGFRDISAALAYPGPPESLVGKWALQLRVIP